MHKEQANTTTTMERDLWMLHTSPDVDIEAEDHVDQRRSLVTWSSQLVPVDVFGGTSWFTTLQGSTLLVTTQGLADLCSKRNRRTSNS